MEGSKIPHELKNLEFCFLKKTTSFLVKCLIWAKSQSVQVFGFGGLNMNQFVSFEVPTQLLSEAAFFWNLKKRCFFLHQGNFKTFAPRCTNTKELKQSKWKLKKLLWVLPLGTFFLEHFHWGLTVFVFELTSKSTKRENEAWMTSCRFNLTKESS